MITSLKKGSKVFELSEGGAARRGSPEGENSMSLRDGRSSSVADFVQHGSNEFALHFGQGGAISTGTSRVK
jgi:hypothetical protein